MKGDTEVMEAVRSLQGLSALVIEPEHAEVVLEPEPHFTIDKAELELTEESVIQLVNYLRVPDQIRDRISMETLELILQELLPQAPPFTAIISGKKIRQFTTDEAKYHRVNAESLLETLDKRIPDMELQRILVGDDYMKLEIVGMEEKTVIAGDIVRAGVMVNFSPIGTIKPAIQSYVNRLVCTNGMTTMHSYEQYGKRYNGNGDDKFSEWFGENVVNAYDQFADILASCRELTMKKVEPKFRAAILENLLKQASMGKEITEMVKAEAMATPPETEWDMLNLLTYATTHHLDDPLDVGWGMWVASKFASEETHAKTCPACHKVMA